MAKPATEEQQHLRRRARRRLIGAIALVTLVAVVLPWILEHEPRPSEHEVEIQIPSQDSTAYAPKGAPGAVSAPKENAERASSADSEGNKPNASIPDESLRAEQDKVLAPPAKSSTAKSVAKDKEKPIADAQKKPGEKAEPVADAKQYVVQIAALADADKASEIQRQLSAKGLKAYTERVKGASGDMTRVRIGPFPNREAAEKERGRIKALGFDGNVTPR